MSAQIYTGTEKPANAGNAASATFTNTYDPADAQLTVDFVGKELSGRQMTEGEFKFLLISTDNTFTALAGATAMTAVNKADKTFAFDALSFTAAGTYYFMITEDTTVDAERVSFDDAVYCVTVVVTDDGNGKLVAATTMAKQGSTDEMDAITFTNVFVPKPADISVDIEINKTVVNKGTDKIGPEDFAFLLKAQADGVEGITVKSDADGKAKFTLTFTENDIGKTYSYKLTEVNSGRANVTYSTVEYVITIGIMLDEQTNTLAAKMTVNGTEATQLAATFENVYDYTPVIPNNPQTGDMFDLTLWVTLMFISGGVAVTLFLTAKKRKTVKM